MPRKTAAKRQRPAEGSPSTGSLPLLASDEPIAPVTADASVRIEVLGAKSPRVLSVRLIKTGLNAGTEADGAQWNVPNQAETLASAVKTFGGARVHWHKAPDGSFEHTEKFGFAKTLTDWAGTDHDAGYLKDVVAKADGVYASLVLDPDVPESVCAALAASDLGLSVECTADRMYRVEGGRRIADLVRFAHYPNKQATVAIVSRPALGGEVMSLAASLAKHTPRPIAAPTRRSTPMTIEQAKALLASTDPAVTPEQRDAAQAVVDKAELAASLERAKAAAAEIEKELAASRAKHRKAELETMLAESKLPEANRGVIRDLLASKIDAGAEVKDEAIAAEIKRQREILGSTATGVGAGVQVGAGPREKIKLALTRLLMGDAPEYAQNRFAQLDKDAKGQVLASREQAAGIGLNDRAFSFRRVFRDAAGVDLEDIFRASGRERKALAASINVAQFGDVFENVLNIAGYAYQESPRYSNWRKIVKVVPFSGTLKQERAVVGGYANLSTVAEGENYPALTSPGDQGHGYTPTKRGGTEDWTIESMLNDRIGALRSIVQKMALAADRTKNDYVFDQLTIAGMPTMDYDSVALFHSSSHGANLLTSALTATSLAAARLAMLKQTDFSSGKRMSITPKFLLVRDDLYQTAYELLIAEIPPGSTTNNAFIRDFQLEVIPVTPTTNGWDTVADWVIAADPNNGLVPTFEMGFEGGREMAEIFVQDMSNSGSMFERDVVTVAVKQPYMGGAPLRHEGFVINDV